MGLRVFKAALNIVVHDKMGFDHQNAFISFSLYFFINFVILNVIDFLKKNIKTRV